MVKLGNEVVAANQQIANVLAAKTNSVNGKESKQGGLVCKTNYKNKTDAKEHKNELRPGDTVGIKYKDGEEYDAKIIETRYDIDGNCTGYTYIGKDGKEHKVKF